MTTLEVVSFWRFSCSGESESESEAHSHERRGSPHGRDYRRDTSSDAGRSGRKAHLLELAFLRVLVDGGDEGHDDDLANASAAMLKVHCR